jgi:hypothetical protein
MEAPALLGLRRFVGRQRERERKKRRRLTKAQRRDLLSRLDPRQMSIFDAR